MRDTLITTLLFSTLVPVSVAAAEGQSTLVQKSSPASDEIYDIYPPVPLPDPVNWPLYIGALAVLLLFAALAFWFFKSRRKEVIVTPDPQSEALAALDDARKLIDDNRPLAYAGEASEILRRFIEIQFSITSTRKTTTEFLEALTTDREDSEQLLVYRDDLKHCLASCDLAKYARKPADREQLEEIDLAIRTFITSTGEES